MTVVAREPEAPADLRAADAAEHPATAPRLPAITARSTDRPGHLRRLLSRAPLVHLTLTVVLCTWVTQHPVAVMLLMLAFPALLVAQEVVERRERRPAVSAVAVELHVEPSLAAAAPAADTPRRTQPRGVPVTSELGDNAPAAA